MRAKRAASDRADRPRPPGATTDSYLYLSEQFPMVPWLPVLPVLPVLQGWQPWEYLEHAALYQRRGIDLTGMGVGIGSVCRRGSQRGVAAVVRALAPLGMLLHGFGVSINALRLIGHRLHSADSQAWSATARREQLRLPGCNHTTRPDPVTRHTRPTDCRNCLAYAARWREEALSAVRAAAVDAAVDAATRSRPSWGSLRRPGSRRAPSPAVRWPRE